jgi:hypothetical protein
MTSEFYLSPSAVRVDLATGEPTVLAYGFEALYYEGNLTIQNAVKVAAPI